MYFQVSLFVIHILLGDIIALRPPDSSIIPTNWTDTPTITYIRLGDLPPPYNSSSASKPAKVVPIPENPRLVVRRGFQVNIYADKLDQPRWLQLTPEGNVLVTETAANRIRLLNDTNGDGVADNFTIFADASNGLNQPFGMAFFSNYFYLGNSAEVRRYRYRNGQNRLEGNGQKIMDLPSGGHWTRNVIISSKENKLYVSVGSASNVGEEPLPRASIIRSNLDGTKKEIFAWGLRNPVGLDFHPVTGALYTTVNERDNLGDDLVPDYLTLVQKNTFYGWPYAYLSPNLPDPRMEGKRPDLVRDTKTPDVLFQSHSAALGLAFYNQTKFPKRYQNGAFVAFRGSWNRNAGTGYKIVFVSFGWNNIPRGSYEDFLDGFLIDPQGPTVWGRPVGVLVLPDGSLIFTEEGNGRIYRIDYIGKRSNRTDK
uniref:Glucose/Sorbosone dehydrogenase domain-containing protein n=1 Tax=Acrobeloides nanus TaxID=290746 RepID=A0A914E7H3_9BILA